MTIDATAAGASSMGIPSSSGAAASAGIPGAAVASVLIVGRVMRRRLSRASDGRPILEVRVRRGRQHAPVCLVRIRGGAALRALKLLRRNDRVTARGYWLWGERWVLRAQGVEPDRRDDAT